MQPARLSIRTTKGKLRTFNAISKKHTQTEVFEALLKVHKEYPHLIKKYLWTKN